MADPVATAWIRAAAIVYPVAMVGSIWDLGVKSLRDVIRLAPPQGDALGSWLGQAVGLASRKASMRDASRHAVEALNARSREQAATRRAAVYALKAHPNL
jgi:hypothetical protein